MTLSSACSSIVLSSLVQILLDPTGLKHCPQAVKEGLEQHGSNLGDEALQVLQRGKPHEM
jgi:hypothetical protein